MGAVGVLMGLACSCGRLPELGDTLDHVEEIVELYPDSASQLLSSLDMADANESDRVRHDLLDAYCRYETNKDMPADSVLEVCLEYYSAKDSKERMLALFLRAGSAGAEGHLGSAVAWLREALDIAERLNDAYWQARIASSLADNFRKAMNYRQYAEYSKMSSDLFRTAGEERRSLFMRLDYADGLHYRNEPYESMRIIDSVFKVAVRTPVDTPLLEKSLAYKYIMECLMGHSEASLETYGLLCEYCDSGYVEGVKEAMLSRSFLLSGDNDAALSRLSGINADSLIVDFSGRVKELLNESAMSGMGDYYSKKAENQAKELERKGRLVLLLCFVVFLIITLGILLYRNKMRVINAEMDSKIQSIMHISEMLDMKSREVDSLNVTVQRQKEVMKSLENRFDRDVQTRLEKEIEILFREKWQLLNMLCKNFYDKGDTEVSRLILLKEVEKELDKLTSESNLAIIENCVNKYMNGIIESLREECPFLSATDIKYLTLVFAGFSADAISMFLGITRPNVYMRKSRLKAKIKKSDYAKKALVLERLEAG